MIEKKANWMEKIFNLIYQTSFENDFLHHDSKPSDKSKFKETLKIKSESQITKETKFKNYYKSTY